MYERALSHPRSPLDDPLLRRRLRRIAVIGAGLGSLVVASVHESRLSFMALLVAALFGGVLGVGTRRWDSYVLFGDVLFGTAAGVAVGWAVVGLLPTLYFQVPFLGAVLGTVYQVGAGSWLVLFCFYTGVFGGSFFATFRPPLDERQSAALVVAGLVLYVAGRLLLESLVPTLGSTTGVAVQGGSNGLQHVARVTQLVGGIGVFAGLAVLARDTSLRGALLATLVVAGTLGGAGVVAADQQFSSVLTASEVRSGVATEVTDVGVTGEGMQLTVAIENPTEHALRLEGGFARVFAGQTQIAWGPIEPAGGPVEIAPGEQVTVEYTLTLSPTQTERVKTALDGDETVQVLGRHAFGGQDGFAVRFRATVG